MRVTQRLLGIGLALILGLQCAIPAKAEEGSLNEETYALQEADDAVEESTEIILETGQRTSVQVPYYEDSYIIENGIESVIYDSSNSDVAVAYKTGISMGGTGNTLTVELWAKKVGTTDIVISMKETGIILGTFAVTVNQPTEGSVLLCAGEKLETSFEYATTQYSYDFGPDSVAHTIHKRSTTSTTVNNISISKTKLEISFDTVGQYKFYVYDGNGQLIKLIALTIQDHTWDAGQITKEATCLENGVKTYTCQSCRATKTDQTEIVALGHEFSDEWTTDKEPTCTEEGIKSHHCIRCDAKDKETAIPELGHEFSEEWTTDEEPTCTEEGIKSHHCIRCDVKDEETPITKLGHEFSDEWTTDKEPTCAEEGSKSHHCIRCDAKDQKTAIPKLQHVYDTVKFKWTDDLAKCAAEFECSVCGDIQSLECNITSKKIEDENCYKSGKKIYTAACSFKDKEYTDEKTIVIPAEGHSFGEPRFQWSRRQLEDGSHTWWDNGCEAIFKCTKCGTDAYADCEVVSKIKEKTCTEDGSVKSTATCIFKNQKYSDIKTETYRTYGHNFYMNKVKLIWSKDGKTCKASCICNDCGKAIQKDCVVRKTGSSGYKIENDIRYDSIEYEALWDFGYENSGHEWKTVWIKIPTAKYRTHVQTYGWQGWKKNGEMSGTSGQSKRLEGIEIKLENSDYSGNIEYRTHVETYGWQGWKINGAMSGTSGQAKRLEAIQIRLTGQLAEQFDVYYRVHAESYGWLGWAKNGEKAGTAGYGKRLEGIEIKLVLKGDIVSDSTTAAFRQKGDNTQPTTQTVKINYRTHVESYGWQNWKADGDMSGTSGQSKRLEGIEIKLKNQKYPGDIEYRTHVETYGWQGWKTNGAMSGTSGQAKRLEAIQIKLTGEMEKQYDVYYRVHAESYGWLGWAKNGENAGTAGYGKRLEGIEVKLIQKGDTVPKSTTAAFRQKGDNTQPTTQTVKVNYRTHVESYGWQNWKADGDMSGTSGQSKRLEGIEIKLNNQKHPGDIEYRTHVETYGWQGWKTNGVMSGTSGQAKRLEAIQIKLTGEMEKQYDVYYRVHAESYGWLGWAKNGESAGTSGYAKRLEGIEIKLVPKGGAAPGSTERCYISK